MATTTITCPFPDNITPLSPNGFMFNITKLPNLSFFCQQVNIPGITLGAPEQATPFSMQSLMIMKSARSLEMLFFASMKKNIAL